MKTTVVFHYSAALSLEVWRAAVANARGGNAAVADLFLAELQAELVRSAGTPDQAVRHDDGSHTYYTWRFNSDTWVYYVIKDRINWPFGGHVRRVIVTAVADAPPA